ncbi:hypothetical protein BDZ91DRAFT_723488 [Kalaharituber pfeilii]|nr:hypothetical protein BDZ91DRAFT_723488 [Kalaharituber pfeilii]
MYHIQFVTLACAACLFDSLWITFIFLFLICDFAIHLFINAGLAKICIFSSFLTFLWETGAFGFAKSHHLVLPFLFSFAFLLLCFALLPSRRGGLSLGLFIDL